MDVLDVDHIELFVGDARQTANVLCATYGFRVLGEGGPETGLPGQRSLLLGQGGVRILLTSGLNADHPASGWVARHGDGVAVIAFGTNDAAGTFAEAVARGATAVQAPYTYVRDGASVTVAIVSGFGDVTHRLIERHGDDSAFLPGALETGDVPGSVPGDLLQIIDHAAVLVPAGELDTTVRYYEDVFGFSMIFEEYIEVAGQGMFSKVVQSPSTGVTFTLIQPDLSRRAGQIDDFLAWHDGAGVQHIALSTLDIVAAVRTFGERGVGFAETPPAYYAALPQRLGQIDLPVEDLLPLGILVDVDHWGQMYQIFARSTHIRRTFFFELIERHGARTFGTSNIPALYAAKERELSGERELAGIRETSDAHPS